MVGVGRNSRVWRDRLVPKNDMAITLPWQVEAGSEALRGRGVAVCTGQPQSAGFERIPGIPVMSFS